jgi:[acyl-carrier-protein] S-malonyltransferase
MSVASHCPLLQSAAEKLSPLLNKYLKDNFNYEVISNVTAKGYKSKDEAI